MSKAEIYYRVKQMLIIVLVALVLISFVGMINLYAQLQDIQGAVNVLMEYITR